MDTLFPFLTTNQLILALLIAVCGGFVKGVVGFAMPLVLISGLTLFIAPEIALAGLILPTLVSNMMQSLRQGPAAAWQSIKFFRVFLIAGGITLVIAAQMVRVVPDDVLKLAIGIPVVFFVALQLTGYHFHLAKRTPLIEVIVGGVAGIMGGMTGVWGPPTIAYLTTLNTPKYDQMRIQGVIYGLGSVALAGAHIGSGVLRAETWPFSAALILPAALGMWIGGKVMDRIDQHLFRRATLFVLLVAGANLIRRAVF
tara:strand:- start:2261 stop:3025 length:765 start_codon:yes stop_codon:yes gene_type:complete